MGYYLIYITPHSQMHIYIYLSISFQNWACVWNTNKTASHRIAVIRWRSYDFFFFLIQKWDMGRQYRASRCSIENGSWLICMRAACVSFIAHWSECMVMCDCVGRPHALNSAYYWTQYPYTCTSVYISTLYNVDSDIIIIFLIIF